MFSHIATFYDTNVFAPSKAYAVYFAYQLKSFDKVKNILHTLYIECQSDSYSDAYDCCMLHLYKGLIHLRERNFVLALFCFLAVMKPCSGNIYNFFQIEAFKRIILLSFIVENVYRQNVNNFINLNKNLLMIKPLETYSEINKFFSSKTNTYKDLELFSKENTPQLKKDKTNVTS